MNMRRQDGDMATAPHTLQPQYACLVIQSSAIVLYCRNDTSIAIQFSMKLQVSASSWSSASLIVYGHSLTQLRHDVHQIAGQIHPHVLNQSINFLPVNIFWRGEFYGLHRLLHKTCLTISSDLEQQNEETRRQKCGEDGVCIVLLG